MTPGARAGGAGTTPAVQDTIVVGAGLIGLATAAAISERGGHATLIAANLPGMASLAAAGMLAPSIEDEGAPAEVRAFGVAGRDRFVSYLEWLAEHTGVRVPLNREGILRVAVSESAAAPLRRSLPAEGRWVAPDELHSLEPGMGDAVGAALYPLDGAVDNVLLHHTLSGWCRASRSIRWIDGAARSVEARRGEVTVHLRNGDRLTAPTVVIASGAWAGSLDGLPRRLPVEPVKGQMIAVTPAESLRRVLFGPDCYLVPRAGGTLLIGSTMDRVGFDDSVDPGVAGALLERGARLCPALRASAVAETWIGFRPVSPDLRPIIDRDPDRPGLIYACGHSRNGVLLAPITGDCVAAMALGETSPFELGPFRLGRFENQHAP